MAVQRRGIRHFLTGRGDVSTLAAARTDETARGRRRRDRALFERICEAYARKDLVAASRIARRMRLLQTVKNTGVRPNDDVLEIGCGA